MVMESMERDHETKQKLAHVEGILKGKDSSGNLASLADLVGTVCLLYTSPSPRDS